MNVFRTFSRSGHTASLVAGKANLEEMNFAFIDMGQGDCTIISCPDNSVYIVDCGSSGGLGADEFNAACALVRAWANGNSINMIMTHPDKDHYNKYIDLLVSKPKVAVNCIYFSRAKSEKSPLGYYKETALGSNLRHLANPMLVEVTLNSAAHSTKKWLSMFDYKDSISGDIPATGYVLKSGTTMGGDDWDLTIIAGNVPTSSNVASEKSNVVSLCTLAQFDTEKLVLTGDATSETLAYLLASQADYIRNASIFQMPHHGSASSTPTTNFKNTANPQSLLVSVGLLNDSYNLPRYNVLNTWATASRLQTTPRVMDYWKTPQEVPAYASYQKLKQVHDVTWKDYDVLQNDSGTFFWLKDPADAGPTKSNTGFYGFTNTGYFLYRVTENKDIYETGILGSLEDGFTGD